MFGQSNAHPILAISYKLHTKALHRHGKVTSFQANADPIDAKPNGHQVKNLNKITN